MGRLVQRLTEDLDLHRLAAKQALQFAGLAVFNRGRTVVFPCHPAMCTCIVQNDSIYAEEHPSSMLELCRYASLAEIWEAERRRSSTPFQQSVTLPSRQEVGDIVSALHEPAFRALFEESRPKDATYRSVEEWVCTFNSRVEPYTPHEMQSRTDIDFLLFLDQLRTYCVRDIEQHLTEARIAGEISDTGVVLLFPDDMTACYLVEFSFATSIAQISIQYHIPNPRSMLSIDDISSFYSIRAKNIAKSFIQGGSKTIINNGVLTAVDRRKYPSVFGPTIDTLLLASIAASAVRHSPVSSVLEIGVGSGHIINSCVGQAHTALRVYGIDIDPYAVLCSHNNLHRTVTRYGGAHTSSALAVSSFLPRLFHDKFDLVVSNPPYITDTGRTRRRDGRVAHSRATADTSLLRQIFDALPGMLNENGRALIMVSSATLGWRDWLGNLDATSAMPGQSLDVPFEVEVVLDDTAWLHHLLQAGAIWESNNKYWHKLNPIWIGRAGA